MSESGEVIGQVPCPGHKSRHSTDLSSFLRLRGLVPQASRWTIVTVMLPLRQEGGLLDTVLPKSKKVENWSRQDGVTLGASGL